MITQENSSRADIVLLRNFQNGLVFEQWRASASQRAVGGDVDALLFAKVDDLLLG